MKITIIFDTAYSGEAAGAVWIVQSEENRRWFAQQVKLDESSAVFTPEGSEIGRAAILRSIWNIQDHYPKWSWINVSGVLLTSELARDLCEQGIVTDTTEGFALSRA